MKDLILHPITVSIIILVFALGVKLWFDERKDKDSKQVKGKGKKKGKEFGKKAKDFGKTTMRILRRKALRKSLGKSDWDFK